MAADHFDTGMIQSIVEQARSKGVASQVLNQVNFIGNTPLHDVIQYARIISWLDADGQSGAFDMQSALYLIEQPEMNIEIANMDGSTPLAIAANSGSLDVVSALLNRKAAFTPLTFWLACESAAPDSLEVMKALVEYANLEQRIHPDDYVNSRYYGDNLDCLALAARNGALLKFQFLVETLGLILLKNIQSI